LSSEGGQRGARQMRAVPSRLMEAMRLPSGKNATFQTVAVWSSYLRNSLPVVASSARTIGSTDTALVLFLVSVTMSLPLGERAQRVTFDTGIGLHSSPVATSQRRTLSSR